MTARLEVLAPVCCPSSRHGGIALCAAPVSSRTGVAAIL
ncbi:hypothetical protein XOCgx_2163 [Xanthomonas oryzae pv. oryzicola]|nr:hypothetical protein XOCgx_2163 [Xanthomonas oryzae pv. oryzicola]